jgi:hypothetical protein
MPHVGPVLEGRTFFCPHCGAHYSATPSIDPKSEHDTAKCVVCGKVMDRSKATKAGSFKSSIGLKMPDKGWFDAASDCRPRALREFSAWIGVRFSGES